MVAHTKEGQYVLTRPATAYKKVFTPLGEKAAIVFEASGVAGNRWPVPGVAAAMAAACRHDCHAWSRMRA